MINIAINGFGRIGRNFLRVLLTNPAAQQQLNVVAINIGKGKIEDTAYYAKYDTLMGNYHGDVSMQGDMLIVGNYKIKIIAQLDAATLPWRELNIDWVLEATGKFTKRELAQQHLQAGAKNILITAPAKEEDVTIIPGINDSQYDPAKHHIVSLGSCTTNAIVPMLYAIDKEVGIENCLFTTVHAYTNSQVLLDVEAKDLRDSRAAAANIIPSTTGATKVISKVLPQLLGKSNGCSLRVPVTKVSIIDLVIQLPVEKTAQQINDILVNASSSYLKRIMAVTADPIVSSDMSNNPHSVIIDTQITQVNGKLIKVFGWYDNEWGYSCRLMDFLLEAKA